MSGGYESSHGDARIRTMQMIGGALIGGTVMFAGIAAFVTLGREPGEPWFGYFALGLSAFDIVAWAVVPNVIAQQRVSQVSAEDPSFRPLLYGAYQARTIVAIAVLEGAAFLDIVAYLMTARWWCLAAAGVLVVLMILSFPTRTRVEQWIETQRQLIVSNR